MSDRKYSLAVCRFPGNGVEHPASSGWVIAHMEKWLDDPRISGVYPLRRSDTPIDMVRNLLVKRCLDMGYDYILMIDSDMQPDVEPDGMPFWDSSWTFMMERREEEEELRSGMMEELDAHRAHITDEDRTKAIDAIESKLFDRYAPATIAAPYCGPPPHELVYVMKWDIPEQNCPDRKYKLKMFERSEASRFGGIFEVAALPTGLILYDARTFRRLPPPWFAYEWADPPFNTTKASTEDVFQTRNASLIGMPQFCNWYAWAGHIKPKVVRKPRPVYVDDVPGAMAEAIRNGSRYDRQVRIVASPDDSPTRNAVV